MKILAVKNTYLNSNKIDEKSLLEKQIIIYSKADTALLKSNKPFFLPDFMGRCDFTSELVIKINRLGKNIPEQFAHRYYNEVTLGINIVASDLLEVLKENGAPWDEAVGFDSSAVVGDFINIENQDVQNIKLSTKVDQEDVHAFNTQMMRTKVDAILSRVSQFVMLRQGDLIFTGTPLDAKDLKISQHIDGYIQDQKVLSFNIR